LNFAASADFTWDDGIGAKTLGIGGTINGTKISIAARNASTGSSATNELRIGNDSAVDTLTLSVNSGANANGGDFAYIMNRRNAPLVIGTNSTERIRIMAGGNVGIGSTNPVAMLDVLVVELSGWEPLEPQVSLFAPISILECGLRERTL